MTAFPSCGRHFDLEPKFVSILIEVKIFHEWGTHKLVGHEFCEHLVRLKNDDTALFCHYLLELYGNAMQIMHLPANYKIFERESSLSGNVLNSTLALLLGLTSDDAPFPTLVFGGDITMLLSRM